MVGRRGQELAFARSRDVASDAHLLSPHTPQSFLSQLYALLRRVGLARSSLTGRFDVGTLAIDVFSREVRVRGQPVEVTPIEFEVLRCLLNNSGRALSYRSLMPQVHG